MNKHNFAERPVIDKVWSEFDYRVVMCGMGDDTAMLIAELYDRGLEPEELVFCDTGSEFPHTYRFVNHVQNWCAERNWSKFTILRKTDQFGEPLSVISLCQQQNTLPAAAFGSKSCSLRFKAETADKYFNNNAQCMSAWGINKKGVRLDSYTGKILRMVGINADEQSRVDRWRTEKKQVQSFPLYDWDIGEHESDAVERVGLYYPGKSSCTICPHLKPHEIRMLRDDYPDLYEQALRIESNYRMHNMREDSSTVGLARYKTWGERVNDKSQLDTMPCECGH